MKLRNIAMLMGAVMAAGTVLAEDVEKGTFTITEMGFGRFRAVDADGTEFLLHMARRVTRLEPDGWQMNEGDKVYVEYWPTYRERPTPTCVLIRLEEPGPKSKALTNPLECQIEEMGRSAMRVRKSTSDGVVVYQFLLGRRTTQYVPAGWVPRTGDHVVVHYSTRQATFGWGHTLVADKIVKQD